MFGQVQIRLDVFREIQVDHEWHYGLIVTWRCKKEECKVIANTSTGDAYASKKTAASVLHKWKCITPLINQL